MNISFSADRLDFEKSGGLIPAIIQDYNTRQVLMMGYMNREALEKTLDLGLVTFYSRSKNRLWTKGESSGNHLKVISLQQDCDADTILVMADPVGPACHTGETSCFHQFEYEQPGKADFLMQLEQLLISRKKELPEGSYTSKMFRKGTDKLAQKVGEEAVETVIAAKNDKDELRYEASDLLFHLLMLLVDRNLPLEDLIAELKQRHGNK